MIQAKDEYVNDIAENYGIDMETVSLLSEALGDDDDGLIHIIEEYQRMFGV